MINKKILTTYSFFYYYYYYYQTLRNEILNIENDGSSKSADEEDFSLIEINQRPVTYSAVKIFKTPIHLSPNIYKKEIRSNYTNGKANRRSQ